ncbi:mutator type transposase, partial [Tanacetum coccineum]
MDQIESNLEVPIKEIQDQLQKKYQVDVSRMKAFRAKSKAVDQVRGDYISQYHILMSYVMELKASNPNTTMRIGVESEADHTCPTRVFKRIYICLGAAKAGFKACMRDFLGFDGAFTKGPFPGQLLTAVGIDSNNGIYQLAYGIVESESKDSWTRFLEHLKEDLELQDNSNFTFISDRQKRRMNALKDFNKDCYDWLCKIPPQPWAISHFL